MKRFMRIAGPSVLNEFDLRLRAVAVEPEQYRKGRTKPLTNVSRETSRRCRFFARQTGRRGPVATDGNFGQVTRTSRTLSAPDHGRVLILSGPVGSGKTTVARPLVPHLRDPACCIEGDAFWPFVVRPGKRDRRQNFHTIMRSMTAASIPFARSGFSVLLDFSIPPDFLATARTILKEIGFDYVVLRPGLEVCARRAAERSEGPIADYKPYHDFCDVFKSVESALSDDATAPKELAARIRAGLASGAFAA
jgi:chloramphenicol 3-O-phosphotransferase